MVIWLLAWALLHLKYRTEAVMSSKTLTASLVLIALGVVSTFPIFFQAFAPAE